MEMGFVSQIWTRFGPKCANQSQKKSKIRCEDAGSPKGPEPTWTEGPLPQEDKGGFLQTAQWHYFCEENQAWILANDCEKLVEAHPKSLTQSGSMKERLTNCDEMYENVWLSRKS